MTLRQERVNKFLLHEVSEVVSRMNDVRLGFLTVTRAEVSPDMRSAQIGVSVLGTSDEREAALKAINAAQGHIRSQISRSAHMKIVPELHFHLDDSVLHSIRVQELLKQIENDKTTDGSA